MPKVGIQFENMIATIKTKFNKLKKWRNQIMKATKVLGLGLIAIPFLFGSCKKDTIAPQQSTDTQGSTMRVKMTDAPGDYAALNVNIVSVQAFSEKSGWIVLNNQAKTISVLDLTNGISTDLATNTKVEAGLYTKLKLVFGDKNQIKINAGASTDPIQTNISGTFDLQWMGTKEVEVEINEEVTADAQTEVLLDFDVAASIKEQLGTYVIDPVIREVEDMQTGIEGTIEAGAKAAVIITGPVGEVSTYADVTGKFKIYDLEPGKYAVKILTTAEQRANGLPQEFTISNVLVSEGQIKSMGVISLN